MVLQGGKKKKKRTIVVTFAIRDPVLGRFTIYEDYFCSFRIGIGKCIRFYSSKGLGNRKMIKIRNFAHRNTLMHTHTHIHIQLSLCSKTMYTRKYG